MEMNNVTMEIDLMIRAVWLIVQMNYQAFIVLEQLAQHNVVMVS